MLYRLQQILLIHVDRWEVINKNSIIFNHVYLMAEHLLYMTICFIKAAGGLFDTARMFHSVLNISKFEELK